MRTDNGAVTVVFTDNTEYTGQWKSYFPLLDGFGFGAPQLRPVGNLGSLLEAAYATNPLYPILDAAFKISAPYSRTRRLDAELRSRSNKAETPTPPSQLDVDLQQQITAGLEDGRRLAEVTPTPVPKFDKVYKWQFTQGLPDGTAADLTVYTYKADPTVDAVVESTKVSVATLASGKVMVVWKSNTYHYFPGMPDANALVALSRLAVQLATELSGGELILDVIGNGGGSVELSAWARQYFFGGDKVNQPLESTCIWVDELMSPIKEDLVKHTKAISVALLTAQGTYTDLANALPNRGGTSQWMVSTAQLFDDALMLKVGVNLSTAGATLAAGQYAEFDAACNSAKMTSGAGGTINGAAGNCKVLSYLTLAMFTMRQVGTCLAAAVTNTPNTYTDSCGIGTLLGLKDPSNELDGNGRNPGAPLFMQNTRDYKTHLPFTAHPTALNAQSAYPDEGFASAGQFLIDDEEMTTSMAAYEQTEAKMLGRAEAVKYSSLYKLDCPEKSQAFVRAASDSSDLSTKILGVTYAGLFDPFLTPAPQTTLKSIKIVTDGTCGSACSQFVSGPYLTGSATLYTYGGVPGEPMDISAFQAGNVLEWKNVWLPMTLQSVIATFLASPGDELRGWWPFATGGAARFAQTATRYPDILGKGSLWREWYPPHGPNPRPGDLLLHPTTNPSVGLGASGADPNCASSPSGWQVPSARKLPSQLLLPNLPEPERGGTRPRQQLVARAARSVRAGDRFGAKATLFVPHRRLGSARRSRSREGRQARDPGGGSRVGGDGDRYRRLHAPPPPGRRGHRQRAAAGGDHDRIGRGGGRCRLCHGGGDRCDEVTPSRSTHMGKNR